MGESPAARLLHPGGLAQPESLEQRYGLAPETWQTQQPQARLEAARRRIQLPPPTAEHLAELQRMSVVQILEAGRQRAAADATGIGKACEHG